jgi:hypothetical protein
MGWTFWWAADFTFLFYFPASQIDETLIIHILFFSLYHSGIEHES